jgi:hypothetical protein
MTWRQGTRKGQPSKTDETAMNAEDALPLSRVTYQLIQERRVVRQRHMPGGAPREFGRALLEWILVSDTVGLMRLAVAEMRRFPDLGEQHQPHGARARDPRFAGRETQCAAGGNRRAHSARRCVLPCRLRARRRPLTSGADVQIQDDIYVRIASENPCDAR